MTPVELLFWLVAAHFVADFGLQTAFLFAEKGRSWYILLAHCAIWTGVCSLPLHWADTLVWWKPVVLVAGHFVCDRWKAKQPSDEAHWWMMYLDQAFHGAQLLAVGLL